jgi:hypothetical protein
MLYEIKARYGHEFYMQKFKVLQKIFLQLLNEVSIIKKDNIVSNIKFRFMSKGKALFITHEIDLARQKLYNKSDIFDTKQLVTKTLNLFPVSTTARKS